MNLRIRELAEQCWINDGGPDSYFSKEKFAELIVKECLDIVEGEDDGSADTKSVRLAMIRMKQHFGVAE
jgi:hypothetical protein